MRIVRAFFSFKLALISKGLRQAPPVFLDPGDRFKLALISKGLRRFVFPTFRWPSGFKLALISKGLRRNHRSDS